MVNRRTRHIVQVALRVLAAIVAVVAAVALVLTGATVWAARRPFPQVDGQAGIAVLDRAAEVVRDELGVAHVYAGSQRDLYRAQGYVHAQERFWQMDVWRHISAGRTAELFGASQLETDRFLRTLGWRRVAEQELDLLSEEARQVLEDYAEGVNAYLEGRPAPALAFEYSVLGLQNRGYEPRPWDPIDTLAFLKLMAWDLRVNIDSEIGRAVLAGTLSDDELGDLFPPYPATAPVITGSPGAAQAGRSGQPSGSPPAGAGAALASTNDLLTTLGKVLGAGTEGIGSNSWVISGAHTASGAPILANDPHLSIQMPSIWYQMALHCEEGTAACDGDVAGFSFAGVPGIVIGYNERVAWGFTNLPADVMDLYVERVNPDNPDQYEVDGQWVDMDVIEETLAAADGTSETIRVRSTRHGPVISGVYAPLDDVDVGAVTADPPPEQYAIALRWTALDPATTFEALPVLNRARNWEDFRSAARLFSVPAQNLVYADVEGNIGYQAPGRIPIRGRGDGTMPLPGWDSANDWTGFIPFEELPSVLNPDEGWIVTANNPVAGDDFPYTIGRDWAYGYRAARIEQLLRAQPDGIDLDDVQRMQGDVVDGSAEWLLPALRSVEASDERVRMMQEVLETWDGQMHADAPGAAAYAATWSHLLRLAFHDQLPPGHRPQGGGRWFEVVRRLLDQPASEWWDDIRSAEREDRDAIVVSALRAAADELTQRLGDDPEQWSWGALHTATFRNGTLGESGIALIEDRFNRGPFPVDGGSAIVNATAWSADAGFEVVALPSMRMIVDLDDLDNTRAVHTTGQSGHAYHPHYTSMISLWRDNRQHQMAWSRAAVDAAAVHRIMLRP